MDAMESGKRPHVDAALRAVKTFVDGVMTLACDSTVTGVTDEDAADARAAVAAAEAALEAEKAQKAREAEAAKARRAAGGDAADRRRADAEAPRRGRGEGRRGDEGRRRRQGGQGTTSRTTRRTTRRDKSVAEGDARVPPRRRHLQQEVREDRGGGGRRQGDGVREQEGTPRRRRRREEGRVRGEGEGRRDAARGAAAAAALEVPVPPALRCLVAELLPRLTHCCFKKSWQSVVGGVAGVDALTRVLPAAALQSHLPRILQALLRALRSLPPHAVVEVRARHGGVPPRAWSAPRPRALSLRGPDAPPRLEAAAGVLSGGALLHVVVAHGAPGGGERGGGLRAALGLDVGKVLDVKATHVGGLAVAPAAHAARRRAGQVVRILDFCLSATPSRSSRSARRRTS